MSPKQTVKSLYAAYASGDADRIASLLHEDVVWIAPAGNATQVALGLGEPDGAGAPRGTNNLSHGLIVKFMAHNFSRLFRHATNEFRSMISEGDLVMTEHRLSAVLPNGHRYVNDYCFAYEVHDGQIAGIREYMDTRGGWEQVFGKGEPRPLLAFAQGPSAAGLVTGPPRE